LATTINFQLPSNVQVVTGNVIGSSLTPTNAYVIGAGGGLYQFEAVSFTPTATFTLYAIQTLIEGDPGVSRFMHVN
jgi:hypothetical protein